MPDEDTVLAYIQGRLSPEEETAFNDALSTDADLRAELAAFTAVRNVFANGDTDMPAENGWARLSDAIESSQTPAANDNRPIQLSLLQVAGVVLVAVLGWQAAVTTFSNSGSDASYLPASMSDAGPLLQVAFSPKASISDVSELLSDLEGAIVGGPSALGLYTLTFPDVATKDAAFLALQQNSAIAVEVLKLN